MSTRIGKNEHLNLAIDPQLDFSLDNRRAFGIKWQNAKNDPDRYACTVGWIYGHSTTNHFFKSVQCGREWCQTCGKDRSIAHERRIDRIKDRFEIMTTEFCTDDSGEFIQIRENVYKTKSKSLGYLVITCPEEYRKEMENPENLKKWKAYWRRKLTRNEVISIKGAEPIHAKHVKTGKTQRITPTIFRAAIRQGIIRYHYCGEDGHTYKPHLNILIPKGWIDPRILEAWRTQNALWFLKEFKTGVMPTGNIYYQYTKERAKKLHALRYVTRATFKIITSDNKHLIKNLKGFRNLTTFGTFDKAAIPASKLNKVLNSKDPDTNEPISWTAFTYERELHVQFEAPNVMQDLGAGVFVLPDILADIKPKLLLDLSAKKRAIHAKYQNSLNCYSSSSRLHVEPPG